MPKKVIARADKIFPYVVPAEYLLHQPTEPAGLSRPLGHGLYIVLVHDCDQFVQNVQPDDLSALRLAPEQAYSQAISNLEGLARNQVVGTTMFPTGPQGRPFVLFGGHWAAATCILLPGLRDMLTEAMGVDDVCVCIPHREALLAFAKSDWAYRQEMVEMIREKESDGEKPLTFSLFELSTDGVRELKDEPETLV